MGNSFALPAFGSNPALTTLDSTTVVFKDGTNDELRTYSWNGTDWSQVGNSLDLVSIGASEMTALKSTTIAMINTLDGELQTYSWDGTDWTQIGGTLSISNLSLGGIALLS